MTFIFIIDESSLVRRSLFEGALDDEFQEDDDFSLMTDEALPCTSTPRGVCL